MQKKIRRTLQKTGTQRKGRLYAADKTEKKHTNTLLKPVRTWGRKLCTIFQQKLRTKFRQAVVNFRRRLLMLKTQNSKAFTY